MFFVIPTIGPKGMMSRATVFGDEHSDQIDKAAGRATFHVNIDMSGCLRNRWLGHDKDALFSYGQCLQREGVGSAACLDSFSPFSEAKRVRQLANSKNAFAIVELNLPLAHSVQKTEIVQLFGLNFTLLLVSTHATVVVKPQAWFLVPLEVIGEIVNDLLRLQTLCLEIDTAKFVSVSAYDYPAGMVYML